MPILSPCQFNVGRDVLERPASNSRVSDVQKTNLSRPTPLITPTTIYRTVIPRPRAFSRFFEIEVATFLPISKRKGDPLRAYLARVGPWCYQAISREGVS